MKRRAVWKWSAGGAAIVLVAALLGTLPAVIADPGGLLPGAATTEARGAVTNDNPPFRIPANEYMGGTVLPSDTDVDRPVKEFTLEVTQIEHEIAEGVTVQAWAFGLEGETPTVPGPELRAEEGDLVRITLKNTHNQPHTIHLHGITSVAQNMDGVPTTSFRVDPGQSYTYEFVAREPAVAVYHCHVSTYTHLDYGMYGMLIIEPKTPYAEYDLEYNLIVDEWDSKQDDKMARTGIHDPDPDYFLINGKASPNTDPIVVDEGDTALINVVNMGYQTHSLHVHGMSFYVVSKDGYPLPEPHKADTISVSPGERYGILVRGRDGTFPIHDHSLTAVTNAGIYPGGMLTVIEGGAPRAADPDAGPSAIEATISSAGEGAPRAAGESVRRSSPPGEHVRSNVASVRSHSSRVPTPLSGPALQGDVTIDIASFAYTESEIRVKPGTTVTWTNRDAVAHTVTEGKPGARSGFDSGTMGRGASWSYTFDTPGVYDYYCLPHPFMTGRVIVE